ncbi:MAG: tRNA (adenosine(37)-N6)-dimethylallyltransferase, partial [Actinomycetota bacterium]
RVVRALEVMELTGAPFSAFRESWDTYDSLYDLTVAGLRIPSSELAPRIYERTRRMFEAGLLDEVRGLLDAGLRSALTASRAIAYPEAVAHLDGEITLEEAMHRVDQASRRYARRQMSWFNRDPRIHWVDAGDPDAAVGVIASMMAKPSGSVRDPDID